MMVPSQLFFGWRGRKVQLGLGCMGDDPAGEQRPLVIHAVQVAGGVKNGGHTVLILVDLDQAPTPSPSALQKMFGLTAVEATLACTISSGKTLDEIAAARGVKIGTIRAQLASIFYEDRDQPAGGARRVARPCLHHSLAVPGSDVGP
jgi:hypothetical protein